VEIYITNGYILINFFKKNYV